MSGLIGSKFSLRGFLIIEGTRVTCGKPFVTNILFIKTGSITEDEEEDRLEGARRDGWMKGGRTLQQ